MRNIWVHSNIMYPMSDLLPVEFWDKYMGCTGMFSNFKAITNYLPRCTRIVFPPIYSRRNSSNTSLLFPDTNDLCTRNSRTTSLLFPHTNDLCTRNSSTIRLVYLRIYRLRIWDIIGLCALWSTESEYMGCFRFSWPNQRPSKLIWQSRITGPGRYVFDYTVVDRNWFYVCNGRLIITYPAKAYHAIL